MYGLCQRSNNKVSCKTVFKKRRIYNLCLNRKVDYQVLYLQIENFKEVQKIALFFF